VKKLTIIDGNSLLFRAYYASAYPGKPLMKTKDGTPTNAIFVFANMINRIIYDLDKGDHLLVAFDTGKKTFRHKQMPSYKAQRKKAPVELITQMPIARELLSSLNIYVSEIDGFEADDVAGTAAMKAVNEGYEVTIFTSDRDFLQLINGNVKIKIIKKGLSDIHLMDEQKVKEEYGFSPQQIIDYKGLCGDPSDNLPGIPGIGPKTAKKLIEQYNSLENIIKNADQIPGKVGDNIKTHAESGVLSKLMATIDTNVKLPYQLTDTLYKGYNLNEVSRFAVKYELNLFLNKLTEKHRLTDEEIEKIAYHQVKSLPDIDNVSDIGLSLDIEEGNYHRNNPFGLAITIDDKNFYMTIEDVKKDKKLRAYLADENIKKYCYDFKAIKIALANKGITLNGLYFDILLAGYTLDTSFISSIENLFAYYQVALDKSSDKVDLFSTGNQYLHVQIAYHCLHLFNKVNKELENKLVKDILFKVEQPLTIALANMESEGFPLDKKMLKKMGDKFVVKLEKISEEITRLAGHTFNISSPKQVANVLYEQLKLPSNKRRSTSADVLKSLLGTHPIIALLLDHRKYAKIISTYIDSLINHVFTDGKLHAMFNQALTSTGRLSSNEPNLQNISIKDEEARTIRKCFYYPEEDMYILACDYSQIELRILAHLSKCKPLIDTFNSDGDIHTTTAKKLFANGDKVTPLMRSKAKAVNFGIIYGISDWGLSEQLNIDVNEAKIIIESFYTTYPEVKEYMKKLVADVSNKGYVETLLGRKRYLREIDDANYQTREFAKRAAMNAPIQGTAADIIKVAMINIDKMLIEEKKKTRIICQIHDELIFKVPKDEIDSMVKRLPQMMEQAIKLDVKLKVSASYGKSWYDTKD
jgi:DNA polymerase I